MSLAVNHDSGGGETDFPEVVTSQCDLHDLSLIKQNIRFSNTEYILW